MSDSIKITIVIDDEKPNGPNGGESVEKVILTQESALTLMPVLLKHGLMDGSFCGGRGDCGRCVVQFLKGAPFPAGIERSRLEPEELRQGYRLACVTRPKTDCTIRIVGGEETEVPIVTEVNSLSQSVDLNGQEKCLSENQKSSAMESNGRDKRKSKKIKRYIIAVDLGTTTIAMQLRDAETGEAADTYCEINPQRRYGTDVLARIQASVEGNGEELRRLVCEVIFRGVEQFAACLRSEDLSEDMTAGRQSGMPNDLGNGIREPVYGRIVCMCIAGNTTMEHLLLGYDVACLGRAPFLPVETGVQKISAVSLFAGMDHLAEGLRGLGCEVFLDFPVYIAPCISAFVGGDIVAGLYELGLFSAGLREAEDKPEKGTGEKQAGDEAAGREASAGRPAVLFVDLGTNGEMAITDGQRMIVTATAAGPAFEGDGAMIGTDRIALTAKLLRSGVLDETGLLAEPYFTQGVRIEDEKEGKVAGNPRKTMCYFKQEDIRALQMAKAAIRAGVEILWNEMGRPEIDQVLLAGGFGYFLDVEAASAIGLLPADMRERVQAVGNTSLAGAYELGRDLCGNRLDAARLEAKIALVESINLAKTDQFERLYLKYMGLGED